MNDPLIHPFPLRRFIVGIVLVTVILCACPALVHAADADLSSPVPLFAGIGKYFSGLATRARVVQLCAVCMVAALLIIMKKFAD